MRLQTGRAPVAAPVPASSPSPPAVAEGPIAVLQRWALARATAAGGGGVGAFYAPAVRFRGRGNDLATPAVVDRYWAAFGAQGASLSLDWTSAELSEETLDPSRDVHRACLLAAAEGDRRVTLVTVRRATEDNPASQVALVGGGFCTHLAGAYLFRMVRRDGALRICHETWSLRDAVCPSCPTATACADARAAPPPAPSVPAAPSTMPRECSRPGAFASLEAALLPGTQVEDRRQLAPFAGEPPTTLATLSCLGDEFGNFSVVVRTAVGWVVTELSSVPASGHSNVRWDAPLSLAGQRVLVLRGDRAGVDPEDSSTWVTYYVVEPDGSAREVGSLDDPTEGARQYSDGTCVTLAGRRRSRRCWNPASRAME